MRTRPVEGFDATMAAKIMLSNSRIERIGLNSVLAAEQLKLVVADYHVQESAHVANAAIALRRHDLRRSFKFESNFAAVTTALVYRHRSAFPSLLPHSDMVICRHCIEPLASHTSLHSKFIKIFNVTNPHRRITLAQ